MLDFVFECLVIQRVDGGAWEGDGLKFKVNWRSRQQTPFMAEIVVNLTSL